MKSYNAGCLLVVTLLCIWPLVVHGLIEWISHGAKAIDWETLRSHWRKQ